MRTRALLASLVLLGTLVPVTGTAQGSSTVQLDLTFELRAADGKVDVSLQVEQPGPLRTIQLDLGELEALEGEAQLEGSWSREGATVVADLEETPHASARWTSDGTIRAQTLEGEGHTTYVGEDFAVVKSGDMVPNVRYSFPENQPPSFQTQLTIEAPDSWGVEGPWPGEGSVFQLDRPLPKGFAAAGTGLSEVTLGEDEDAYRLVRVAGTREDSTTERILLQARSYLAGVYGRTIHQQFIVVAPDPMFRGGLGSPAGVFLHGDADANVVAHEMVHAYQGFRFSRAPGEATIWLGEGSAVVHGVLLEVASGVKTREEARTFLQERAKKAEDEHAVDLTTAVYGSGNEQAAYTKGAVVVTALDDRIREATENQYTLADVLKHLNGRGRASERFVADTETVAQAIRNVTGYDPSSFFDRFVYDSNVPELGSIFPGQASIRILGTDPDPPVAGQPFQVSLQVTNLDTQNTTVDIPVKVDDTERGRLVATLGPGATVRARADVEALDRGSYTLKIQGAQREITVPAPADPSASVTVWPRQPVVGDNVTVGARISNAGEAPLRGTVSVVVDGETVLEREVHVPTGEVQTISRTLAPLALGRHEVRVLGPDGLLLASGSFPVGQQPDQASAPGAGAVALVTLLGIAARLSRGRARR